MEALEQKLAELNNEFKTLKAKLKAEKRKVRTAPLTIGEVFPGDVWVLPKNKGYKHGHFCKVKSVNKKQNHVEFEDGWNPLDSMLSGTDGWVLVSRELTPLVKAKAEAL